MESIAERLKYLRDKIGVSMNKLEDSIGAPRGSVNKWEKGSIPGGNYLIALSDFFEVSTDWILKGREGPSSSMTRDESIFFDKNWETTSQNNNVLDSLDEADRAFIDRYIQLALFQKQQIAKSPMEQNPKPQTDEPLLKEASVAYDSLSTIPILGRAAAGVPIEMVRFIEGYLKVSERFKNCFAVQVNGESMIKAGIVNNGYVVVRQQNHVENNEIALVMVDEKVTIKRFKMSNDLAYLISENDGMEDMVYDPKEKNMQILGLVVDIVTPEQASEIVVDEL